VGYWTLKLAVRGLITQRKRAAAIMSLIQSARLNGHDPYAYLKDALTHLPTQPASKVNELLPHRWAPFNQASEVCQPYVFGTRILETHMLNREGFLEKSIHLAGSSLSPSSITPAKNGIKH
jgi:hypothetical protein